MQDGLILTPNGVVEGSVVGFPVGGLSLTKLSLYAKIQAFQATWPSGKARVCKTLITGSNPVVASPLLPPPFFTSAKWRRCLCHPEPEHCAGEGSKKKLRGDPSRCSLTECPAGRVTSLIGCFRYSRRRPFFVAVILSRSAAQAKDLGRNRSETLRFAQLE